MAFTSSIKETPDGGFIVAGHRLGDGSGGPWLVKLDSNFNIVWQRFYGNGGISIKVAVGGDGSIIAVGTKHLPDARMWAMKCDSIGNVLWARVYAGGNSLQPTFVDITSDGGFAVTGSWNTGTSDAWAAKFDTNGSVLWQKAFGGNSNDTGRSIHQTSDGGYVIAASTASFGNGLGDAMVLKLSATGSVQWKKTFGGPQLDNGYEVEQLSDGSYILAAGTASFRLTSDPDWWVITMDSAGGSCVSNNTNISTNNTSVTIQNAPSINVIQTDEIIIDTSPTNCYPIRKTSNCGNSETGPSGSCSNKKIVFTVPTDDAIPPSPEANRVLIHKYGEGNYPGSQVSNGEMEIVAKVLDESGQPLVDEVVYLRVADPKDTSAYRIDAATGDNIDKDTDAGILLCGVPSPCSWVTDENGFVVETSTHAKPLLRITDQHAGDNYQIEVAFDSNFSTIEKASGTITAWKRIYLETDKMFKRGSYVKGVEDNKSGADRIHVMENDKFDNCNRVQLIHAPRLDSLDFANGFYSEEQDIVAVVDDGSGGEYLVLPAGNHLDKDYSPDASFGGNLVYLSDAVGCISGNDPVGTYEVNDELIKAFELAFVEFLPASQSHNLVPFRQPVLGGDELEDIPRKWFENSNRDIQPPAPTKHQWAKPNHQHIIYASSRFGSNPISTGTTDVDADTNYTWIWYDGIKSIEGSSVDAVAKEILFHELGHQWQVNRIYPDLKHCDKKMAPPKPTNLYCAMDSQDLAKNANKAQRKDGIVGFHFNTVNDSEYMTIRKRVEPVPQVFVSN